MRIESDAAHAERGDKRIDRNPCAVHAGGEGVELRGVDRPQRGLAERHGLFDDLYLTGRNRDRCASRLRHDASIRCGDAGLHRALT